jgi:hypothetical protein
VNQGFRAGELELRGQKAESVCVMVEWSGVGGGGRLGGILSLDCSSQCRKHAGDQVEVFDPIAVQEVVSGQGK